MQCPFEPNLQAELRSFWTFLDWVFNSPCTNSVAAWETHPAPKPQRSGVTGVPIPLVKKTLVKRRVPSLLCCALPRPPDPICHLCPDVIPTSQEPASTRVSSAVTEVPLQPSGIWDPEHGCCLGQAVLCTTRWWQEGELCCGRGKGLRWGSMCGGRGCGKEGWGCLSRGLGRGPGEF